MRQKAMVLEEMMTQVNNRDVVTEGEGDREERAVEV
jgi:hypothetical protein